MASEVDNVLSNYLDLEPMAGYLSPLSTCYASQESDLKKVSTWWKLWVYLAEVQKEVGLHISDEQI